MPSSTLSFFFFFLIRKRSTITENTEALFGKINTIYQRQDCILYLQFISYLFMPIIDLFAKIPKLPPYYLYLMVTLL